jgi:hypothetical protein
MEFTTKLKATFSKVVTFSQPYSYLHTPIYVLPFPNADNVTLKLPGKKTLEKFNFQM